MTININCLTLSLQNIMGDELQQWRQRVGLFAMPSVKTPKRPRQFQHHGTNSLPFSSPWLVVLFGFAAVIVLVDSVLVVQQKAPLAFAIEPLTNTSLPICRLDQLLVCGDIETNPGPEGFTDEQLEALKSGRELGDAPSVLLNIHIQQLHELKKSSSQVTWDDVLLWLAQCTNIQVTDLPNGKSLRKQWETMHVKRRDLMKR